MQRRGFIGVLAAAPAAVRQMLERAHAAAPVAIKGFGTDDILASDPVYDGPYSSNSTGFWSSPDGVGIMRKRQSIRDRRALSAAGIESMRSWSDVYRLQQFRKLRDNAEQEAYRLQMIEKALAKAYNEMFHGVGEGPQENPLAVGRRVGS